MNAKILAECGQKVDFLESCKTSPLSIKNIINFFRKKKDFKNIAMNPVPDGMRLIRSYLLPPQGYFSILFNLVLFNIFLKHRLAKEYSQIIYYVPIDLICIFSELARQNVVYDCVRAFSEWGGYHDSLYQNERYLLSKCRFVLCDSYYIKEVHLPSLNNNVVPYQLIPPLETKKRFGKSKLPLTKIKRVGYFGSISMHVDVSVFEVLVRAGYEVVFWGVDDTCRVPLSVKLMGYISNQETLLSSLLENCEALILPYIGNLNGVYPAKLPLCFATGLPTFSTVFYDAKKMGDMVYLYNNHSCLLQQLRDFDYAAHTLRQEVIVSYLNSNSMKTYREKLCKVLISSN